MHKMEYNKYLLLLLLLLTTATLRFAAAVRSITGIYAFGDSIFDAGNNNKLSTLCRADHLPYGSAMPDKYPGGRFSNGKLPTDILIAEHKPILPAYLTLRDDSASYRELPSGVTFASACSGFDDVTALNAGVHTLTSQFDYFVEAYDKMERNFGVAEAIRAVETALLLVSGGTNDMLDNYYSLPLRKIHYSLSSYHDLLLSSLETFVKKLYKKGAKRMGVLGMPPLGCLPRVIDTTSNSSSSSTRECVSRHNSDARQYNAKLEVLIKKFHIDMPLCKFAYVDIYNPILDMVNDPQKFGLYFTHEGCCETGSKELGPLCSEDAPVCEYPPNHLFWDAAHPTFDAYKILTRIIQEKTLYNLLS